MESATTSNNDPTDTLITSNFSISTDIITSQGKENSQQLLVHSNDQDNIIYHDKNDEDVNVDVDGNESKTKNDNKIEDVDCSCPICLHTATEFWSTKGSNNPRGGSSKTEVSTSDKGFVYSSTCGHIYCVPCIQQILLYSSSASVSKSTNSSALYNEKNNETTPVPTILTLTQGLCPLCRAELSYFDLKTIHLQRDNKSRNKKFNILRTDETLIPKDDITTLPNELYGKKFQSNKTSTFLQFPKDKNDDTGIIFYKSSTNRVEDDQPYNIFKLQKYQYYPTTHTLKGWGKRSTSHGNTAKATVEYRVWLTFSGNFMFVTHGVARFTMSTAQQQTTLPGIVQDIVFDGDSANGDHGSQMLRVINQTANKINRIAPTPKRTIRYKNSTYWGNIFCQHFKIGYASYHFITKPVVDNKKKGKSSDNSNSTQNGMAYVSYEHPSTSSWLPLDNGRPMPSRVLFRNISCPDQYTFCGSICWEEDYNSTCQGSSRWDYKMKFDTKFMCIVSGTVHYAKTNNKTKLELKSTFGNYLLYVNAGLYDSFSEHMITKYGDRIRELKESDSPFPIIEMVRKFSMHKCELIADRLLAENVTSETGYMLLHILKAATYNINNGLFEILKEKPNSDVAAINCGMEKEFNVNPIDSEYYFE